jgi:transglutaminase-like putative cysteine protease
MNAAGVGAYERRTFQFFDGERGTAQTIDAIKQLVQEGLSDPRIRRAATDILHAAAIPAHDELGEVWAIYRWVLQNIRFTGDMVDREMLQPAADILISRAGDCDDINAVLIPALLGSIGYPSRAVTIKSNPDDPDNFSHIYVEVLLPRANRWIPLDAAREGAAWGHTPEHYWEIRRWPLTEGAKVPTLGYFPRPRARYGLGQDGGFDWGSLIRAAPGLESGAAQIVSAARAPTLYIPPGGYAGAAAPGTFNVSAAGGASSMVWIIAGVGVLALLLMSRR